MDKDVRVAVSRECCSWLVKYYRMSLMISFVLELKGDERIEGDCLSLCFFFIIITEVRR